jgi:type IV pilus assembly protein PilF
MKLLAVLLVLLLSGCQTTEQTTRTASGGSPGSRPNDAPAPAQRDPSAETEPQRRAKIRVDLAANYYQESKHAIALEELRLALLAVPDYAPAFGMYGLVYMALNENQKADTNFQRALAIAPTDPELNNNYGWFLCQTNRPKEAIAHFEVAVKDPLYATPAKPLHNAGICSLRTGDERAAEGFFVRAFQIDAGNPVAMYNLAELYLRRGDFVRAKFYSQRLVASYEPSAQVLWQAIRLERKAGNRSGAESYASQLRRRFPSANETNLLTQGIYD